MKRRLILLNRIQLVFEETAQLLVPLLESPQVQAVCEYSAQTEGAEWLFRYNGPSIDPTQADDDLGLTLLKGMTKRMDYAWKEAEVLPNSLAIKIK